MPIPTMFRRRTDRRIVADRAAFDERHGPEALARVHDAFVRTTVCELEDLPRFLDLDPADIEFVLRQECYATISRHERFNRALISAVAASRPLTAGLPHSWRGALREQGFSVAGRRSAIRWGARATLGLGLGVATYLLHLVRITRPVERRRANGANGPTAYMHTVASENLPIGLPDLPATDVVSWLEQNTDLLDDIDTVASRVEALVSRTRGGRAVVGGLWPLAVPTSSRAVVQFVRGGSTVLAKALRSLLRSGWTEAMLARMLVDATLLQSTQGTGQALAHLFNTSALASRPLWTIVAPQFGIRSLCYHYSTNAEDPLSQPSVPNSCLADWRLCWWDEQLVWDTRQAAVLQRAAERPGKVRVVGPISFVATTRYIPNKARGALAVFDVTPWGHGRIAALPRKIYETQELIEAFICNLAEEAHANSLWIAWKTKREVGDAHDSAYRPFQQRMQNCPGVVIVEPSVSAQQLIAACCAAVSLPFTSTAHIAHAAGKPSAFYDPFGAVVPGHPAGRGLPILSAPNDLRAWLHSLGSRD